MPPHSSYQRCAILLCSLASALSADQPYPHQSPQVIEGPGAEARRFPSGHVYIADGAAWFCAKQYLDGGIDRIWEVDPETGEVSLFAELTGEDCGSLSGLVFTPDGTRLRAASTLTSRILDFDPDGRMTVAYDLEDGVFLPLGTNCMAYDRNGDFYVVDEFLNAILRFPADGGAATTFAGEEQGVDGGGSIAFTTNGDLYYGNLGGAAGNLLWQLMPSGDSNLFDSYGFIYTPTCVAANVMGNVFVTLETNEVIQYTQDAPASRTVVYQFSSGLPFHAIVPATGQSKLYVAKAEQYLGPSSLYALELASGVLSEVAFLPESNNAWTGIATAPFPVGDVDLDDDVDLADFSGLIECMGGPSVLPDGCWLSDLNSDSSIDLRDVQRFYLSFRGSGTGP